MTKKKEKNIEELKDSFAKLLKKASSDMNLLYIRLDDTDIDNWSKVDQTKFSKLFRKVQSANAIISNLEYLLVK